MVLVMTNGKILLEQFGNLFFKGVKMNFHEKEILKEIFYFLGPKPASFCYYEVYRGIHSKKFTTINAIKKYLKSVLCNPEPDGALKVAQAKEIWLYMEHLEKLYKNES